MPAPRILYLCALLMDLGLGAALFAIGRRAAELNASAFELGLLGATTFGAYTLFALTAGSLSDRWGRRPLATGGVLLAASMVGLAAVTTQIPWLLLFCVCLGAGMGGYWPSIIAWLGEGVTGPELARRLSRFSMGWNSGLLIGFGLTGWVFERHATLAFGIATAAMIVIAFLLQLRQPPPPPAATDPTTPPAPPLPAIPKGRGFRKTAWIANFGVNFVSSATMALFPQLATALGIEADVHGGLFALSRFAALVVFWALQHLHYWRTRLWPLWLAQLACAAGLTIFTWSNHLGLLLVALVILGGVSGYAYQCSIYFTLEEMTEKGKGGGFHEAILGSGMFLGPILAGLIGNRFDLRAPYLFCAIILATLTVVQLILVAAKRH